MTTNMKQNPQLDANTLLREAEASEHKEAYRTLEKTQNYRIGAGVRLAPPNPPSFFLEILLYLAPHDGKVDVAILEKTVSTLRTLQKRGFNAMFQDGNCISCETQVSAEQMQSEYQQNKTLISSIFGKDGSEHRPNELKALF